MSQDQNDIPTNDFFPKESDFSAMYENDYLQKTKFQRFVKTKGVYVAMASTMLGLFAGIPILIWFSTVIMISVGSIFVMIFIFGAIGLLQWKYFRNNIDMEYRHYAMFSFTGFAMFVINIILLLNFTVRISKHSETYKIGWIRQNGFETELIIDGVNERFEQHVNTYLNSHSYYFLSDAKTVTVVFEKGLFGFDMIGGCKFK